MPNDFRNCCHYRFNHSIYDHTDLNNGNAAESAEIHCYYVTQYNDATTPILFSGSTTLSAITVEMNNAWKRGEMLAG